MGENDGTLVSVKNVINNYLEENTDHSMELQVEAPMQDIQEPQRHP
jgi:hypothetical protein